MAGKTSVEKCSTRLKAGFSLVRKCIDRAGADLPVTLDGKPFKLNRTFNNDVGMVVVIDAANAAACAAISREAGEINYQIGVIAARGEGASVTGV